MSASGPRRRRRWLFALPAALAMAALTMLVPALAPAQATTDEDVLQYGFQGVQVPAPPPDYPTDGYAIVGCQGDVCRLVDLSVAFEAEVGAPTFSVPGELAYSTAGRGGCGSAIVPPFAVALSFTEKGVSGTVESFEYSVDCGDGSVITAEPSSTTLTEGTLQLGQCYFTAAGCAVAAGSPPEAVDESTRVVYDVTIEQRTIDDTGAVTPAGELMDGAIAFECTGTACVPVDSTFFRADPPPSVTLPGSYDAQQPQSGDLCGGDYSPAVTTSLAFTATEATGFVRDELMTSDCGGGTSSLFGSELAIVASSLVEGECWFTADGCATPAAAGPVASPVATPVAGGASEAPPAGAAGDPGTGEEGTAGDAGTSSRLASGDPAAPSVLSALAPPAQAGIAPQQLALAALLTVILVLLMSFPTSLLNSAIDGASERFAEWRERRGAGPAPTWQASWWWAAIGVLAAALISAFVDPQFGANPGSLRVLVSIALGFAVDVVLGWVVLQWVMRRLAPDATRSFSFKPLSLLIVIGAVVFTRITGFEPGIVFGLVAGLGFATTVGIAAKARTTLVPLAYAFGLGILAWIVFGIVAERSGESLGMTLLVETLSALTVGGMVALPLALVPVKGLGGHTVWQASRRLWAACYGVGLFAFFVVLMPMPFSWTEVGWELWAWIGVYAAYAAVAVTAWLFVKQPWKAEKATNAEAEQAEQPAATPEPSGVAPTEQQQTPVPALAPERKETP